MEAREFLKLRLAKFSSEMDVRGKGERVIEGK